MRWPTLMLMIIMAVSVLEPVFSAELPDFPFVFAVGEAKSDLPPEFADVSFRVLAYNEESSVALDVVHRRTSDLVNLFKTSGIAEADITSYELDKSVRRRQSDRGDYLEIMGYEVSRRFEVKVRNLDNYTTFMNALFAMDNTEGISVDFDRTDRERVEFDLIGKATEDARRQATALARGAGAELGPAFALSRYRFAYVSDNFGLGTYFSSMSAVSGPVVLEQAEQLFIPATITFDCTVNVIYELKQP